MEKWLKEEMYSIWKDDAFRTWEEVNSLVAHFRSVVLKLGRALVGSLGQLLPVIVISTELMDQWSAIRSFPRVSVLLFLSGSDVWWNE